MIFSCDVNAANNYFLKTQGKILEKEVNGFIFREYIGNGKNRNGWLFPKEYGILSELSQEAITQLKIYLQSLLNIDFHPNFILLTEEQKEILSSCINENFPEYKISFESDEGDSDYIYSVEKMSALPGKDFQKKRNHVSRFLRTYGNNWEFVLVDGSPENESKLKDFQKIYLQWKENHNQENDDFLTSEEKSFNISIDWKTFVELNLIGGILFTNGNPGAFLLASFTGPECLNIHFEKCVDEVADNGGLAVLNQQFAKSVQERFPQCKYLNREEDLNIPGLRKSKLSYKPEFMIKKYFGKMETK